MYSRPRPGLFLTACLGLLMMTGCSREPDSVASLVVSPSTIVVRPGQCTPVTLSWTPTAELVRREGEPTVFVHVLDGPHNLVRTFDHRLDIPWNLGQSRSYEIDICQSAIAPYLEAGTYSLKVGLYDHEIGYRWPLTTNGVDAGSRGYRVAQIVVPASRGAIPDFALTGAWAGPEDLGDKQTRVRRGFSQEATIDITRVERPGTLRLLVRIPASAGGATEVAGCGGSWTSSLEGTHVVKIPVSGNCRVALTSASGAHLESVGWSPAAAGNGEASPANQVFGTDTDT